MIDFFPYKIINGKIHKITIEKEKGKKFKCHLLIPIQDITDEKELKVLKEITIQGNDKQKK